MICTACDQPIDLQVEDPHYDHERWCVEGDVCDCDLPVHPDCCTRCRAELEGQLSVYDALGAAS